MQKNNSAVSLPEIYVPKGVMLPDEGEWQHRIMIRSESSDNVYIVSQHKTRRHWGCSCPGWCAHRKCKHLTALGLPVFAIPFEVNIKAIS